MIYGLMAYGLRGGRRDQDGRSERVRRLPVEVRKRKRHRDLRQGGGVHSLSLDQGGHRYRACAPRAQVMHSDGDGAAASLPKADIHHGYLARPDARHRDHLFTEIDGEGADGIGFDGDA